MGSRGNVVLDTNVLVSALGWDGPERRVYRLVTRGSLRLLLSRALLEELERVLHYPKFQLEVGEIRSFVDGVRAAATMLVPRRRLRIITDDPSDNEVLECALEGTADWIVSGDHHLLDLESFHHIPIVTARELLARLEGTS
ncbi:MAG: putative toxin-antitoxin system toxin component, PIN family [Gemmatimonadota bacterium]